jgi:hypothetical protein
MKELFTEKDFKRKKDEMERMQMVTEIFFSFE